MLKNLIPAWARERHTHQAAAAASPLNAERWQELGQRSYEEDAEIDLKNPEKNQRRWRGISQHCGDLGCGCASRPASWMEKHSGALSPAPFRWLWEPKPSPRQTLRLCRRSRLATGWACKGVDGQVKSGTSCRCIGDQERAAVHPHGGNLLMAGFVFIEAQVRRCVLKPAVPAKKKEGSV